MNDTLVITLDVGHMALLVLLVLFSLIKTPKPPTGPLPTGPLPTEPLPTEPTPTPELPPPTPTPELPNERLYPIFRHPKTPHEMSQTPEFRRRENEAWNRAAVKYPD